jgi:outer membrane receptor protein involved in Fe transport
MQNDTPSVWGEAVAVGRSRRRSYLAGVSLAVLLHSGDARAEQRKFDLTPDDAIRAIPEFARQAKIQIISPASGLKGIRTPEIRGSFEVRDALNLLLRGTNLEIASDEAGVITLRFRQRAAQSVPASPPAPTPRNAPPSPRLPQPRDTAEPVLVDEIVITGSRIVRNGYQAPTPVSVLGAAEVEANSPVLTADYVNTLPALSGSALTNTFNVSCGCGSIAELNLRNLGVTRTLVLVDGQRSVPSVVTGQVDVNNIPEQLIARIDIVTGGASAAYGSDALSGVVNFVLDKNYRGLKGTVSGGVTTYGDNRNWKVALTGGFGLAEDRGHFLFSGQASHADGINVNTRPWAQLGWHTILNPEYTRTNGLPSYISLPNVGLAQAAYGGIIVSGPLKGITFGPGGVPYNFDYGSGVSGNYVVGGDWKATNTDRNTGLAAPVTTQGLFARLSYDLSDGVNVFAQASWNYTHAYFADNLQYNEGNILIKGDNAFIPAPVAAQIAALKITSFTFGDENADIGQFSTNNARATNRYVAGASGRLELFERRWTWDAYYQYGETRANERIDNTTMKMQFANAIDAVRRSDGMIVCRSTLTNPNNGCVPLNIFGIGVASRAALNYVQQAQPHRDEKFAETAIAWSARGEPFSNWAGPLSLALGVEHREERVDGFASLDDLNNNFFVGNFLPNHGSYTVTEGFVETVIPLAKNVPWARALDLNAAIRATGYSISGYVTTWKAGLTYTPIDDIRFRMTRSRDIRAPNLSELFATGTGGTTTVNDPFNNNAPTQDQTRVVGNLALAPEKADETGLGLVLQPLFIPEFDASIDYYAISINNAIGTVAAQDVLNLCYIGQQQFCSAFTRGMINGVSVFTTIEQKPFNFIRQRARGIDFEASYSLPLSVLDDGWNGTIGIRALATHFIENYTNAGIPGLDPTDTAGENSGSGPPSWKYTISATYRNDPVTLVLTSRGISAGTFSNAFIACTANCPAATTNHMTIASNRLAGAHYFDANITYRLSTPLRRTEIFLAIKNLMDTDPAVYPQLPIGTTFKQADFNPQQYDYLGRIFTFGLRFQM